MSRQKVILLLIVILAFSSVVPTAVRAQTNPTVVGFTPQPLTLYLDAPSQVAVIIQDVQDLYAFDVTVQYDPNVLEVIDAAPGAPGIQISQGDFLDKGMTVINRVDEEAGMIQYAATQLNPAQAKEGSGVLLVISLRGKKEGTTTLTFANIQLSTRQGEPIAAIASEAVLNISGAPLPPGPTPTPFAAIEPQLTLDPGKLPTQIPTSTPRPTVYQDLDATAVASGVQATLQAAAGAQPTPAPQQTAAPATNGQAPGWISTTVLLGCTALVIVGVILVIVLALRSKRRRKPQ